MDEIQNTTELDEVKTERPDYAEQLVKMLHSDIDTLEKKETKREIIMPVSLIERNSVSEPRKK